MSIDCSYVLVNTYGSSTFSRAAWAWLLARVYEVDALRSGLLRQGLGRERRPFKH